MKPWTDRPQEVANLLNPAFCGEVLRRCINRYQEVSAKPFPYPLVFLVLPIVLHRKTRINMPRSTKKQMHVWLQQMPEVKIGFAERCRNLLPITQEALTFLLQAKALELVDQAGLVLANYRQRNITGYNREEINDCYKKAEIVGCWLARSGSPATIFAMWGVKP